jgi:hypothetical protein
LATPNTMPFSPRIAPSLAVVLVMNPAQTSQIA